MTEKSCNIDLRATRAALFCLQETLVSSANASVLPEPFLTSLLIFASSIKCSNGLGTPCVGRMGSILGSNSNLSKQICSPMLYWRGDGLSPCGLPRCSCPGSDNLPFSRIIFALRPVPRVDIISMNVSPKPKNRKASLQKSLYILSNALLWSIDTITPGIALSLQ